MHREWQFSAATVDDGDLTSTQNRKITSPQRVPIAATSQEWCERLG